MSLIKETVVDQITVIENGAVLYRQATRIMSDSEIVACTFHRTTLTPGADLTGQPEKVAAIAQAAWTPEVVAAYEAEIAALKGAA